MKFIRVSKLDEYHKNEIWDLYRKKYHTNRERFFRGLPVDGTAVLFTGEHEHHIVGFFFLETRVFKCRNKNHRVIFTSDLVISKSYQGRRLAEIAGLIYFLKDKIFHPFSTHYLFLAASSFVGCSLMIRNFKEFWPQPASKTPREMDLLKDTASDHYFGRFYEDYTKTAFLNPVPKFNPVGNPNNMDHRGYLEYYQDKLPEAEKGQALVCIAPISRANFKSLCSQTLSGILKKKAEKKWIEETRNTWL